MQIQYSLNPFSCAIALLCGACVRVVGGIAFTTYWMLQKKNLKFMNWAASRGSKSDTELTEIFSLAFLQTRSQLIKAGVKLLIQSKRKNSGSSSCDADYRPPPAKIRATSVTSPISRTSAIPIESPSPINSLNDVKSPMSMEGFHIKTDDTSSCDEDSESKFSTGKHEVIKVS